MNRTKSAAVNLVILTALSLFAAGAALSQEAASITSKLDEYLSAAAKQGFTGSALISRDGKVIFSKGYGLANIELDVPNTPQTKFRLGSITKQFNAASILLLQERGKLSVQDPICKYFDNCPSAWTEITIHHLLSHTGGVPIGLLPARLHYRKGIGRVVRGLSTEEYLRPVKTEGYGLRSSQYYFEESSDGLLARQKQRDQFAVPGYGAAIFGWLPIFDS